MLGKAENIIVLCIKTNQKQNVVVFTQHKKKTAVHLYFIRYDSCKLSIHIIF